MKLVRRFYLAPALLASLAVPAFAGVTIASPTAGEAVNRSFPLSANASVCSAQQVGSIGYSLDNSNTSIVVRGNSISRPISAPAGQHTVHVKAWGQKGALCVAEVNVHVGGAPPSKPDRGPGHGPAKGGPNVPPGATKVTSVEALPGWRGRHDAGTPGKANGTMSMSGKPAKSGNARKFVTRFTKFGGQRYAVGFADDVNAKNFVYDGWIFLENTASKIANIEMDLNQVTSKRLTVIFGFQCDGWSGTWDYTGNKGTAKSPKATWIHSGAKCNPRTWAQNTWHHVQISYSRDQNGAVTYHSVWLDGAEQAINRKVFSAFSLGWAPTMVTNFQIDSGVRGSTTATVYLDNLALYRW